MLEKNLQLLICNYLKVKYPKAIFRSDFASGMRMSIGMARRHKALQSSRSYPDIFIAAPVGKYCGLFIELKKKGTIVYKKDGTIRKDAHLIEQEAMLLKLFNQGYQAIFGIGYADTIKKIDKYFEGD